MINAFRLKGLQLLASGGALDMLGLILGLIAGIFIGGPILLGAILGAGRNYRRGNRYSVRNRQVPVTPQEQPEGVYRFDKQTGRLEQL